MRASVQGEARDLRVQRLTSFLKKAVDNKV